jgi:hypothetical protein
MAAGAILVTVASLGLPWLPTFWPVAAPAILPLRGALYTFSDNAAWLVGCNFSTAAAPAFTARCLSSWADGPA